MPEKTIVLRVEAAFDRGETTVDDICRAEGLKPTQVKEAIAAIRKRRDIPNLKRTRRKEGKENQIQPAFNTTMHKENKGGSGGLRKTSSFIVPARLLETCIEMHGLSWGTLLSYILGAGSGVDSTHVPSWVLSACHPDNIAKARAGCAWSPKDGPKMEALCYESPYQLAFDHVWDGAKNVRVVFNLKEPRADELLQIGWEDGTLVDGLTGRPALRTAEELQQSDVPEIEELRARLNSQAIDYSKYSQRLDLAFRTAADLPLPKRVHQVSILRQLRYQMQPEYSAKANTRRLYAAGPSLQNLNRELRSIVFDGEIMLDLAHCQYSVLAATWDIPVLNEYLDNLWVRLTQETGIGKDPLKTLIYSAAYGSSMESARLKLVDEAGIGRAKSYEVMNHAVFFHLFARSSEKLKELSADGFASDAFGTTKDVVSVSRTYREKSSRSGGANKVKARRSILASQAQSYELKLLLDATMYLLDNKVEVLLWLHDGLIVRDAPLSHVQAAMALVDRAAKSLKIATSLRMETIGS